MFYSIKKAAAAAALLVALPALASAQTVGYGTAPVSVTSCNVSTRIDRTSFVGPLSRGSGMLRDSAEYTLNYVDTANVAATSVTFALSDGKALQTVVARGNFAPGVNNASTFTASDAERPQTVAACTVAQVKFTDGHVWQAIPSEISSR